MFSILEKNSTSPILKTKKFSNYHIQIFDELLNSQKTNRSLNEHFGYSQNSHVIVDHTRKVMFKILAIEGLSRLNYMEYVIYPRKFITWWKLKLEKNRDKLDKLAVQVNFYVNRSEMSIEKKEKTKNA